jgi:colanic acid biosynthesis glycosyl transferase WcaI
VNVLVICPHFAPDVAPTGEVMTSIVTELAELGDTIHVITALPWYRLHAIEPDWRGARWRDRVCQTQATEWGAISRLNPFPSEKTNIPARAVSFAGFTMLALGRSLAVRRRPDLVLVMSPPLPLGVPGWLFAMTRRVPLVLNIQDVFPDVAVELGAITNRWVIAAASALERFLYRRSAAVTVLSEDLRQNLAAKLEGHSPDRVRIIPNFVDIERVVPADRMNAYRQEFGLGDRTVVMYAGNVGLSQSVELVIAAAARLVDREDVVFVVNGGGSGLGDAKALAQGLPNVVFVPMQPRERLAEVLAAADIHTIPLKAGLARSSVPSKLYSILASARPVVASVDPGSEVERVLEQAGAGVSLAPSDIDGFVEAIRRLIDDVPGRRRMGQSGRAWVERWLSPRAVAVKYQQLFDEVTLDAVPRPRRRSGLWRRRG